MSEQLFCDKCKMNCKEAVLGGLRAYCFISNNPEGHREIYETISRLQKENAELKAMIDEMRNHHNCAKRLDCVKTVASPSECPCINWQVRTK